MWDFLLTEIESFKEMLMQPAVFLYLFYSLMVREITCSTYFI